MQFNAVFKFNLDRLVGTRKVVMYKVSSSVLMGIIAIAAVALLFASNPIVGNQKTAAQSKIMLKLQRTQVIRHLAVLSASKIPKPLFSVSVHIAI